MIATLGDAQKTITIDSKKLVVTGCPFLAELLARLDIANSATPIASITWGLASNGRYSLLVKLKDKRLWTQEVTLGKTLDAEATMTYAVLDWWKPSEATLMTAVRSTLIAYTPMHDVTLVQVVYA